MYPSDQLLAACVSMLVEDDQMLHLNSQGCHIELHRVA